MSLDILQPLDDDEIPQLLDVLSKDLPHSAWIYNFIKTQFDWARKMRWVRLLVLCPYGDWTLGTVIALNIGLADECKIFGAIHSMESDAALLKKCLMETDSIPWRAISDYVTVSERHADVYLEALEAKGLRVKHQATCAVAYMPPQQAANLSQPQVPSDVRIASLDANLHLEHVWQNWPPHVFHPAFKPVLKMTIKCSPSFGIFVPSSEGPDELASVVVQSDTVGLGILRTADKHRRKGFAKILLVHATKMMGECGTGPLAYISAENSTSIKMFKKIGYEIIGQTRWISISETEAKNEI
ncbi:uncharacterized protein LOC132197767 [Neocloeon triangulifer]|uniref:uncharacterized protein LOC132197767 n=1 Tax=Neocloeon triangulifer TaxID=2078957 RepID=UPI00286F00A3|nr:uncharacterized protein LOC132197767 [Neocloeon triangulifer]